MVFVARFCGWVTQKNVNGYLLNTRGIKQKLAHRTWVVGIFCLKSVFQKLRVVSEVAGAQSLGQRTEHGRPHFH